LFTRALLCGPVPVEVTNDKAGPYLRVLDDLVPAAAQVTEQFGNSRIEADHGRLKAGCGRARTETLPLGGTNCCRPYLRPEPELLPARHLSTSP
jgi:hypothetical protein